MTSVVRVSWVVPCGTVAGSLVGLRTTSAAGRHRRESPRTHVFWRLRSQRNDRPPVGSTLYVKRLAVKGVVVRLAAYRTILVVVHSRALYRSGIGAPPPTSAAKATDSTACAVAS